MSYYFDLTLVNCLLVSIVSLFFIKSITLKHIRLTFYLINGILSFIQILYIYCNFYLIFIIYFLLSFILFKKYFFDNQLFYVTAYFIFSYLIQFLILLFFNCFKFYNGIFCIEKSINVLYLFLYPLVLIVIYLITLFVDKCFHLLTYKDKVFLIINQKKYVSNGYIDTGNTLKYNNVPVIFLCKNDSNKLVNDKTIVVSTINGKKEFQYFEGLISIGNNTDFFYVYICLSEEKSFNGCDILLNAYLL